MIAEVRVVALLIDSASPVGTTRAVTHQEPIFISPVSRVPVHLGDVVLMLARKHPRERVCAIAYVDEVEYMFARLDGVVVRMYHVCAPYRDADSVAFMPK